VIQVRAVGKGAVASCENDECDQIIELSRSNCCGGGPGGGEYGCGKYLCASHMVDYIELHPMQNPMFPKAPRKVRLCNDCLFDLRLDSGDSNDSDDADGVANHDDPEYDSDGGGW
jgi:hypothetical protein